MKFLSICLIAVALATLSSSQKFRPKQILTNTNDPKPKVDDERLQFHLLYGLSSALQRTHFSRILAEGVRDMGIDSGFPKLYYQKKIDHQLIAIFVDLYELVPKDVKEKFLKHIQENVEYFVSKYPKLEEPVRSKIEEMLTKNMEEFKTKTTQIWDIINTNRLNFTDEQLADARDILEFFKMLPYIVNTSLSKLTEAFAGKSFNASITFINQGFEQMPTLKQFQQKLCASSLPSKTKLHAMRFLKGYTREWAPKHLEKAVGPIKEIFWKEIAPVFSKYYSVFEGAKLKRDYLNLVFRPWTKNDPQNVVRVHEEAAWNFARRVTELTSAIGDAMKARQNESVSDLLEKLHNKGNQLMTSVSSEADKLAVIRKDISEDVLRIAEFALRPGNLYAIYPETYSKDLYGEILEAVGDRKNEAFKQVKASADRLKDQRYIHDDDYAHLVNLAKALFNDEKLC